VVAHANGEKTAASAESVAAAFKETRVEIEEREWKIQSLEKQIADAGVQKVTSNEKTRALIASLDSLQSALNAEKEQQAALKEQVNAAIRERDETLVSVRGAHEQTKTDLDVHKNNLIQLNRDLEAAALLRSTLQGDIASSSSRIKELEHDLKSAVLSKDQNSQQVRLLSEELGTIKAELKETSSALAGEKEEQAALKEQLNAAIRERDETLVSVRGAHEQTKTDLEVHRNDILRLNRDLEAATRLNSVLLGDFNAASVRIDELTHELNSVIQGKEQTGQQARSLSDDLEGTKAELETERRIRRTAEVNLQKSIQLASRLEGDIARSTAEREQLKAAVEQERLLHTAAVERVRAATQAKEHVEHEFKTVKEDRERHDDLRAAKIQKLNQDFELVLARQRDLEHKVKTLESEKAAAEARAEALSDEIQQARTALADEWEDHMNDEERLAATERKAVQLEQSLSRTGTPVLERERKWAVVVTSPPVTRATPLPPLTPEPRQEATPSQGIEDLFEDDPAGPGAAERTPEVPEPPVNGSAAQDMIMDEDPVKKPGQADEHDADGETDENGDAEEGAGDLVKTLDDFVTTPSSYGISFNRQQWLGLLKWSHHSGALSQEQRMQIVRMGRLIQNGRKLTKKQDEQIREMMMLVQTLGYRFP
jgi:chromosome segregation ATPase